MYMYFAFTVSACHADFYKFNEFIGDSPVELVKVRIFLDKGILSISVFLTFATVVYLFGDISDLFCKPDLFVIETLPEQSIILIRYDAVKLVFIHFYKTIFSSFMLLFKCSASSFKLFELFTVDIRELYIFSLTVLLYDRIQFIKDMLFENKTAYV